MVVRHPMSTKSTNTRIRHLRAQAMAAFPEGTSEKDARYGQVTRYAGHVSVIWDLQGRRGLSVYSERYLDVGELVRFVVSGNRVTIFADHVSISDLPKGTEPLITVPTPVPSPTPPDKHAERPTKAGRTKRAAAG
jgi:hypothetical protein